MESEHQPLIRRNSEEPATIPGWFQTNFPMFAVLLLVGFERLAFYAISGDLVYYLNGVQRWNSNNANIMAFTFIGFYSIMSVLGGLLADRVFGKYKTILIALVIYLIGYALLTWIGYGIKFSDSTVIHCYIYRDETMSSFLNFFTSPCIVEISIALFLISLGSGCLRATVAPFGADQLTQTDAAQTRKFFNWLYWSINIGAFMAVVGISWVQLFTKGAFFTGYLIALICLAVATIIMFIGYRWLIIRGATGRYPVWTLSVVVNAIHNRLRFIRQRNTGGEFNLERKPSSLMDWAMDKYRGNYSEREVEDVKKILKVLLLLALLIPWWLTYDQVNTTFLTQGLHMTIKIDNRVSDSPRECCNRPRIPPPWLSVFDAIVLITLLPLLDRKIYPALDRRGIVLKPVTRIAIGMVFAIVSVVVAGTVEHYRLHRYRDLTSNHTQYYINQCFTSDTDLSSNCKNISDVLPRGSYHPEDDINCQNGKTNASLVYNAADMNIAWQIPQYALVGISEAFTSVASMELAYTEAPARWRSTVMGWYYFFSGIGSFSGSAIIYVYSTHGPWKENLGQGSINCGRVEYYFYILGGILFVGLVVLLLAKRCLNLSRRTLPASKQKPTSDAREPNRTTLNSRRIARSHRLPDTGSRRIQPSGAVNKTDVQQTVEDVVSEEVVRTSHSTPDADGASADPNVACSNSSRRILAVTVHPTTNS